MKNIIVYDLPFDNWDSFERDVRRFAVSFKNNPPGLDYELWAMCSWGEPTDWVRELFYGIKTKFVPSYIGCEALCHHLAVANAVDQAHLLCLTARTYFHRPGWLWRYREARGKFGPGMYGAFASMESDPHICTRGYMIDAELLRLWPYGSKVVDRSTSWLMERGQYSLTRWLQGNGHATVQVLWDSEQFKQEDWRKPDNIFRKGNQEQCLLWDRHTQAYAEAKDEERNKLEALTDGVVEAPHAGH